MRCPKCGSNVPEGKTKCPHCFAPISSDQPSRSFSVNPQSGYRANNEAYTPKKSSADIYEKNVSSVAIITVNICDKNNNIVSSFTGSGCLVSKDGYIITNTHVVYDEEHDFVPSTVEVQLDGRKYVGRVLRTHEPPGEHKILDDIALVKVDASFPTCLALADYNAVKPGDEVTAIGNALGWGINVTRGIVSDTHKYFYGEYVLASDVGINGGNSGGPLFNSKGEIIAICDCSPTRPHEAMNFFIPINHVKELLKSWGYSF